MLTITVNPDHTHAVDDLVIYGTHHRVTAINGNVLTLEPFDFGDFKTNAQAVHDAKYEAAKQRQVVERDALYAQQARELRGLSAEYLELLRVWVERMETAPKIQPVELAK